MDLSSLLKYLYVATIEAWHHKFKFLVGFVFVAFVVLMVGARWSAKFETSTTIFADNQNILRPLLDEQAAQSNLQDQTRVVRDMLHSPRMLAQVVDSVYGLSSFSGGNEIGGAVNRLRERLVVKGLGRNYIKISYFDDSADQSYRVLNTVIELDQDALNSIGNEGRKNITKKFDVEAMCDSTLREYKKLLDI